MNPPPVPIVAPLEGQPLWLLVTAWLVWAALVYVLTPVLLSLASRVARRTRSQLDDLVIGAARGPLRGLLLLLGAGIVIEAAALPERFTHYARPTVFALIAFTVVVFADRLVRSTIALYLPDSSGLGAARSILVGAARGLVIAVGALIVLDSLGVSINAVLATFGIGSLAVALGLQDTLSQFLAGIFIAVDQPIRMGDYVRVATGEEGIVERIGWRSTRLRMTQNSMVIIPNAKLAGSSITNFHMPRADVQVQIPLMVAYGTDLRRCVAVVTDVACEVLAAVPGGLPTAEPVVRFSRFGEIGVEVNVTITVAQYTDQFPVRHELLVRLDERFRREGIVVPYPIRELRLGAEERALFDPARPEGSRPG